MFIFFIHKGKKSIKHIFNTVLFFHVVREGDTELPNVFILCNDEPLALLFALKKMYFCLSISI